jgi:DNA-binding SARP family transcriptional activator
MARLEISLLGPFRVTLDGDPVAGFVSDKVRALLAYLAVEGAQPQRRETLAGLLWGDYPERSARASLRNALSNLRQVIGDREAQPPFLYVTPQAIQLHPEGDVWVDVAAFARAVGDAGDPGAEREMERLEAAVSRYRGGFLEGFSLPDSAAFEEWALLKREQLQRQMLAALGALVEGYERRGDVERALAHAWRLVELEPYPEAAQRQLMRLLAANGQRELALAQYERYRRLLSEDLGVAPGQETVRLYEGIRDGEDLAGLGYLSGLCVPPHNLPAQSTPFVGREKELGELQRLLAEPEVRLVTVVGPGGIGKTRLALQCAEEVVAGADGDGFPDGVYFVPLAPARTGDAVVSTVAQAIGFSFPGGGDPKAQLLRYLQDKRMLLVLDNVEQLVASSGEDEDGGLPGEGAAFLLEALRRAPGVKLLVTSRERLNASGEHVLAVPGMEYPPQDLTGFPKPVTPFSLGGG